MWGFSSAEGESLMVFPFTSDWLCSILFDFVRHLAGYPGLSLPKNPAISAPVSACSIAAD